MKKDKLKSVVLKFSIVFFIVIALLTYFSKTINNMLLPKVKVFSVQTGVIDDTAGSNDMKTHYLLPVSSVDGAGNTGIVFVINKIENGDATVEEVSVDICNSDELSCVQFTFLATIIVQRQKRKLSKTTDLRIFSRL